MASQHLMASAVRLGASVDALAALAAFVRLETEDLPADPAVRDLLLAIAADWSMTGVAGVCRPGRRAGDRPGPHLPAAGVRTDRESRPQRRVGSGGRAAAAERRPIVDGDQRRRDGGRASAARSRRATGPRRRDVPGHRHRHRLAGHRDGPVAPRTGRHRHRHLRACLGSRSSECSAGRPGRPGATAEAGRRRAAGNPAVRRDLAAAALPARRNHRAGDRRGGPRAAAGRVAAARNVHRARRPPVPVAQRPADRAIRRAPVAA